MSSTFAVAGKRFWATLALIHGPLLACGPLLAVAAAADPPRQKNQTFAEDPHWEGFRNHLQPENPSLVRQDFGYRATNRAGGVSPGEIGGHVQRSPSPAFYALPIKPRPLDEPLHASGKLAVPIAEGGSGVMIGWFQAPPQSWRTPNSLAFRVDGNGGKFWVFYEYGTQRWRTGGGGAFTGEQYQRTSTLPFPADGKSHAWAVDYDPHAASDRGQLTFRIDDRTYELALAEGHRGDRANLDHFGIWNVQIPGETLEIYLDDIVLDGESISFDNDPAWHAVGNETEFTERLIRPYHDFGYQTSNHAGGSPGEIGGVIFRDEQPSYYADTTGPLSLDDELIAEGTLSLEMAASDSGVYLGWFNAASKQAKHTPDHETPQRDYLAILIEGPSRTGHLFRPGYGAHDGRGHNAGETSAAGRAWPVIFPEGKAHPWRLHYRPQAAGGNGQIEVTLDGKSDTLDLDPGIRQSGATFDRFGLFNLQSGGHGVELYVDDLSFTTR